MRRLTPDAMLLIASCILSVGWSSTVPPVSPAPPPFSAPQCERAPPHAQPADRHYRLGVAGDPDLFLPGELYTVSLQGVNTGQGPTPFSGFTIWVEQTRDSSKTTKDEDPKSTAVPDLLGTFQAYDAQSKIDSICAPAANNATGHPKTEIQVIWSAPSITAGACVRLCARLGPTKNDHWSFLARKLCAAPAVPSNVANQPLIVEPCCACDEAKYEVTFESLWSRHTHPREFPPESARAHFSEIIGASHTAQYRVWQEGRVASSGMRRLADDGATTALEKELKAESDHIRTIIKARGISWQQIAAAGSGNPSTFAVFRVDPRNHLVSLASKLVPSPDWIVGVSALELCALNCTWTKSFTMPLFPYDAGSDNGLSYMSRRVPTIPASPVRALRPDWPMDVRSPFFSTVGEMRPFARLRFTRLRLYEKGCEVPETGPEPPPAQPGKEGLCVTNQWSAWSPCSVTCGEGFKVRQREYIYPSHQVADTCRAELTQRESCNGPRYHCRAQSEYEPDPAETHGPCAVSAWSEWSPCEGCGVRARTRHYLVPRAQKRCHVGYRARTVMDQAMPCDAGTCEIKPDAYVNMTDFDWFFVGLSASEECRITPWGPWSPCSARCGRGRRLRTRLYIMSNSSVQNHMTNTLLSIWNRRYTELQNITYKPRNWTVDPEVEKTVRDHIENCQFTLTAQEALCDGNEGSCEKEVVSEDVCRLPIQVGHCRDYYERWFYDMTTNFCEPFGFTGCGGNANNFRTHAQCKLACADRNITALPETTTTVVATTTEATDFSMPPIPPPLNKPELARKIRPPSIHDNDVMLNDESASFVEGTHDDDVMLKDDSASFVEGININDNKLNDDSASFVKGIDDNDGKLNDDSASFVEGIYESDVKLNNDPASYVESFHDNDGKLNNDSASFVRNIHESDDKLNNVSASFVEGFHDNDDKLNDDSASFVEGIHESNDKLNDDMANLVVGIHDSDDKLKDNSASFVEGTHDSDDKLKDDSTSFVEGIHDSDDKLKDDSTSFGEGIHDSDDKLKDVSASFVEGIHDSDDKLKDDSASFVEGIHDSDDKLKDVSTSFVEGIHDSDDKLKDDSASFVEGIHDNDVMLNDISANFIEDVDCTTGPWLGWTDCIGDCEYSFKLNYRNVLYPESGGGKQCSPLIKSRECQPSYCREHIIPPATTTPSPVDEYIENYVFEDGL